MKEFDHPNVLNLRGVCLDGGPAPFIIMPFMHNGSLQLYLKENRDSLVIEPSSIEDDMVRFYLFRESHTSVAKCWFAQSKASNFGYSLLGT